MKILVIIPCYNEEKNIVNTVNDLKKVKVDYQNLEDMQKETEKQEEKESQKHLTSLDLPITVPKAEMETSELSIKPQARNSERNVNR